MPATSRSAQVAQSSQPRVLVASHSVSTPKLPGGDALTSRVAALCSCFFAAICALVGCASAQPTPPRPSASTAVGVPPGFFIPRGTFGKAGDERQAGTIAPAALVAAPEPLPVAIAPRAPVVPAPLVAQPVLPPPVPVAMPLSITQPVVQTAVAGSVSTPMPRSTPQPEPLKARAASPSYLCMIFSRLQGCEGSGTGAANSPAAMPKNLPLGFFLPPGTFANPGTDVKPSAAVPPAAAGVTAVAVPQSVSNPARQTPLSSVESPAASPPPAPVVPTTAFIKRPEAPPAVTSPANPVGNAASADPGPQVAVYASVATKAYFSKTGVDGSINVQVWSVFLAKYRIPFQVITGADKLEMTSARVLVLPSTVVLSEREKLAVITLRAKGVNVLASWLTGVRSESGDDLGYGFMEKALDVKVLGTTEAEVKEEYLLPHGDNPVTHYLEAGTRIWMERIKGLYPLRLAGRQTAAQMMDWSRTPVFGKATSAVVFDERTELSGRSSRSIVLGFPEQLWLSADPKQVEAMAYNAVVWLLRQPAAYVAAWPYPFRSAFVMAVDLEDTVSDIDMAYAKRLEEAGGRGTYYVLSETASKSPAKLNKLKAAGHEIAYLGDNYTDFRGYPEAVQSRRLDKMRQLMKDSGVEMASNAGFHAPMDSFDKTTEKLLQSGGFGYLLAANDASEARLPFFATGQGGSAAAAGDNALVVLPRTQSGPEDSVDNCQPEVGLKPFLNELDLSEKMAGLSVVSVSGKSDLTEVQSAEIFSYINARRERSWLTTAGQVADWWRERRRVSVRLEPGDNSPRLVVSIGPGDALRKSATVLVNLSAMASTLRLVPRGIYEKAPRIAPVDAWRAAVVLDGMATGEYQWDMYFDVPAAGNAK